MKRRRWRTVMLWIGCTLCASIICILIGLYWLIGANIVDLPFHYAALLAAAVSTLLVRRFVPKFPRGNCRRCGYNLRGLTEARCPECGQRFEAAKGDRETPVTAASCRVGKNRGVLRAAEWTGLIKETVAVVLLFSLVAAVSVLVDRRSLTPRRPQRALPNRLVVTDAAGAELLDIADRSLIERVWVSIHEALLCPRGWVWNPSDNLARLFFRFADGADRKFILTGTDRIIELGPAPDQACRTVNSQELMGHLLKSNESP